MLGKYRAYPEYKDSGAQWLGLIPNHWDIFDGKRVFNNRRELASESDEQLAASQRYGVVPQSLMMEMNDSKVMLALKGTSSFRHVEKNDYVISLRSFEGGIEHSNYVGCVSPAYTVLSASKSLSPSFYKYFFKSKPFIVALQSTTDSLRDGKSITFDQFGSIPLVLPDTKEQLAIANFLDHETAKIDTLIEKQQQLIQLLKEKRQAVISHAVTKGLNPSAKMKDSGVEWLGEVPEHWEVCRVKQASDFITSGPRGWSDFISENGEEIFLQSGDLDNKLGLNFDEAKRVLPPKNAEGVRTKLETGDVVVCITGANTGRVAVVQELNGTVYINQHLSLVRAIKSRVIPLYLGVFLSSSSVKSYFTVKQYGLKEGLSLTNISETPLCLPPIAEQVNIIEFINRICASLDSLEIKAQEQVALLQERRTALISATVTGKIDVRNWQAPKENQTNREVAA